MITEIMHVLALVVEGGNVLSLIDACREKFSASHYSSNSGSTHILLIEKYFLRTNSNLGAIVVLDREEGTSYRVDMGAVSGGLALLRVDLG